MAIHVELAVESPKCSSVYELVIGRGKSILLTSPPSQFDCLHGVVVRHEVGSENLTDGVILSSDKGVIKSEIRKPSLHDL